MLSLRGAVTETRGFERNAPSRVLRLRDPQGPPKESADAALVRTREEASAALAKGFDKAIFVGDDSEAVAAFPHAAVAPKIFDYLRDGDIIALHPDRKRLRTLHRHSSLHNSFLVTERCNNYCLMCSQPPRDVDDGWVLDEIKEAIPLVSPQTRSFAFTGGEPLTEWREFIDVLHHCKASLPNTAVHVLTNGRAFASSEIAKAWADVQHHDLMAGIPVYSAVDHVHDYVVQAQGAFDETVLGILKLKDRGQRVEIRVVLHAITAPRLVETCTWLARNIPFVDHVALMGLENTGFALANQEQLWIDPLDYQAELSKSVEILSAAGVQTSIYNLTRCVLPRSVWPFAVQSISDWKNGYVAECDTCIEKPQCSGFFTSGRPKRSRGIAPITSLA